MDVHTPEQRSYNMSRIKGRDTGPELLVRRWLWSEGYRYRLYRKDLPGKPDIVFSRQKKVIFVHGCFWHKHNCGHFKLPRTNREFWEAKISENIMRDRRNTKALADAGWSCFIAWECKIRKELPVLQDKLREFLES